MKRYTVYLLVLLCTFALCSTAFAEACESVLGYSLAYDAELFSCESDGQVDVYRWRTTTPDTPACFMSVSILTGYTLQEAMEGLKLQAGRDGIDGSTILSGAFAETFRFYEGNSWNSRVCEYACIPMSNGAILLIETDWYLEAEEGIGQKLLDLRSMVLLHVQDAPQMAKCDICGGWYEEGNVFRNHICVALEPTSMLIATTSVNLRVGAGLNSEIVTSVSEGTQLIYGNETMADERGTLWYRVLYNQKEVWVSSKYVRSADHAALFIPDNAVYVITTASVNLRKGPGEDYDVISSVSVSSELPYVSQESDQRGRIWYQVAYKEGSAWVSSEYARIPC